MPMQAALQVAVLGALTLLGPPEITGAVTETTGSNKPPFSFACGTRIGGGTPTFCAAGDKKYLQVESVSIFRDYSNEVGVCLDREKEFIAILLHDWFNYDCKTSMGERSEENKRMPIDMLKEAMATHCGIANPGVTRIVVNYECVRTSADGNGHPVRPLPPMPNGTATAKTATQPATLSTTPRAPTPTSAWTSRVEKSYSLSTQSAVREPAATSSSGSNGGIAETNAFNYPPFSFACGAQTDSSQHTFCNGTGDKKYLRVRSVYIYQDTTSQVGDCLELEKNYIAARLTRWFNNDCQTSHVEKDKQYFRMPVNFLKSAMAAHCGGARPDVNRIAVNYVCDELAESERPALVPIG